MVQIRVDEGINDYKTLVRILFIHGYLEPVVHHCLNFKNCFWLVSRAKHSQLPGKCHACMVHGILWLSLLLLLLPLSLHRLEVLHTGSSYSSMPRGFPWAASWNRFLVVMYCEFIPYLPLLSPWWLPCFFLPWSPSKKLNPSQQRNAFTPEAL